MGKRASVALVINEFSHLRNLSSPSSAASPRSETAPVTSAIQCTGSCLPCILFEMQK